MPELDSEQRELLRAYADATRPSAAEVERALAQTLARTENAARSSRLPHGQKRVVWMVAAGFVTLLMATGALAGIRWLRAQSQSQAPAPSYGAARFEQALPPHDTQAQQAATAGEQLGERAQAEAPPAPEPEPETDSLSEPESEAEAEPEPEPEPEPELELAREAEPAPSPKPRATPKPEAAPEDPPSAIDAGDLADENRLLARARKALDAGDHAGALDWVEEHARRHPRGALEEERLILEAVAACRDGQRSRGHETLTLLRQRFPGSPALTKIERACEL